MGRFWSDFWRRIRIRNQNQPITSGFWEIWGYVLEKWGFSLLLRLCTGRKKFFWFVSRMSSFSTTLSLKNKLLNSHERFFFTKIRPYQVLTFIRTTLWAFTLTLWCIPFCIRKFVIAGFDGLWIRIYSQKIDISISKIADSKWRIEIYEIKRFCSLKIFGHWEIQGCLC